MVSNLSHGVIKNLKDHRTRLYICWQWYCGESKESGKKEEKRTTTPPTAKELMSLSKCSVGCIECNEQLSTGWKRNHSKMWTIFVGLIFVARCSCSEMDLTIMILLWPIGTLYAYYTMTEAEAALNYFGLVWNWKGLAPFTYTVKLWKICGYWPS